MLLPAGDCGDLFNVRLQSYLPHCDFLTTISSLRMSGNGDWLRRGMATIPAGGSAKRLAVNSSKPATHRLRDIADFLWTFSSKCIRLKRGC
jgi:hypothetical protein